MNGATLAPYLETIFGVAFACWGAICVFALLVGLPGTWILIASAVLVDALDRLWLPAGAPFTFHPITIAGCIALAAIGELLEFALSAAGAKRFGASARGMWGSVVGGVVGAIAGTLALPIIGTLVGAALGTAAGAVLGELSSRDKTLAETAKPALGAVIGRLLGTLAKLPIALVVWVVLAVAAFA
jgi:uncharacterized protein YqgC (DUF456 family)